MLSETGIPEAASAGRFDAIIIGASVAGCICALYLANKGWRVLVLEQRALFSHYKRICTHILHPYAVQTLQSLGLFGTLRDTSALPTFMRIHYQQHTLHFPFGAKATAANIERRDLDPLLREALATHPRISLQLGSHIKHIESQQSGNRVFHTAHNEPQINSTGTLILADGRASNSAWQLGAKRRRQPNGRVALFAYVRLDSHRVDKVASDVWSLDQGAQYLALFPNRSRALVSWYMPDRDFDKIQQSKDTHFDARIDTIRSEFPHLGERVSAVMVAKDTSPVSARLPFSASRCGVFMVGDAKLAADPLTGVGCAWAMRSARLLAACLGDPPVTAESISHHAAHRLSRVLLYRSLHWLSFAVPSYVMTLASKHGHWIFNSPVFRTLSFLSRPKRSQSAKVNSMAR